MRVEFPRVTPESVGISSAAIEKLLNVLEGGFTEMHSLQIMRFGKICAEGWWGPYAPGVPHNLMSVTKTYAATAIGIAYTEGLLQLENRIIDLFAEEAPSKISPFLQQLTIRDILCMGCGMENMPSPSSGWIRDFLATPVIHPPGNTFMYNSIGSSLLAAIIKKCTNTDLRHYLKVKLFDKIGIDADNLKWVYMPDGTEAAGAGLYATTEDNLRLMKLYADGGFAGGEQILSSEYIRLATSAQIDSSMQGVEYPFAYDNVCGYGFQIWMCRPEGAYRADGAMGQFCVVLPRQNMLISITETGKGIDGPQKTLDALWDFLNDITADGPIQEQPAAAAHLARRLSCLSLPRPVYQPFSRYASIVGGRVYGVTSGVLRLENPTLSLFCGIHASGGISKFAFSFEKHTCMLHIQLGGSPRCLYVALDGSRALNTLSIAQEAATLLYLSGAWITEKTFSVFARWIETSFEKELRFHFEGDACTVTIYDPIESYGPLGPLNESPVHAISEGIGNI